jgi:membrane protein YdbS with pleckstrin-like domain
MVGMSSPEGSGRQQPEAAAPHAVPAVPHPGPPGGPAEPGAAPVREAEPFEPAGVDWTPVSPRLASARLVVALAWPSAALVAVLVVWVLWLVPRQVRAMGYAERADDLLLRRGILFRSMVVVPYGRMQYVDVTAGPLARKLGIASVQLHTASPGTDASIDGLPTAEAARLRDQLASRGEARLAGL